MDIWKAHSKESELRRYEQQFKERSFYDRQRTPYRLATALGYLSQALSLVTAFALPFLWLSSLLPHWGMVTYILSGLLSFGLLLSLESGIRVQMAQLMIARLKALPLPTVSLAALVLLVGISFSSSILGARKASEALDTRLVDLSKTFKADTAAINQRYQSETQETKQALAEFKQSVSWKGQINIENATNKKVIGHYTEQLANIAANWSDALRRTQIAYENQRIHTQKDGQDLSRTMGLLAGGNILFFIGLMFFQYYYRYRSVIEETGGVTPTERKPETETQTVTAKAFNGFQIVGSPNVANGSRYGKNGDNGNRGGENGNGKTPTVTANVTGNDVHNNVNNLVKGYKINCANCGTSVQMRSSRARFCSDACRMNWHRNQQST